MSLFTNIVASPIHSFVASIHTFQFFTLVCVLFCSTSSFLPPFLWHTIVDTTLHMQVRFSGVKIVDKAFSQVLGNAS